MSKNGGEDEADEDTHCPGDSRSRPNTGRLNRIPVHREVLHRRPGRLDGIQHPMHPVMGNGEATGIKGETKFWPIGEKRV